MAIETTNEVNARMYKMYLAQLQNDRNNWLSGSGNTENNALNIMSQANSWGKKLAGTTGGSSGIEIYNQLKGLSVTKSGYNPFKRFKSKVAGY